LVHFHKNLTRQQFHKTFFFFVTDYGTNKLARLSQHVLT
jgi:hypothetical protein